MSNGSDLFIMSGEHARVWALIGLLSLIVGCAGAPPRNPVPAEYANEAGIPGIPKARYPGDRSPPWANEWLKEATAREMEQRYGSIMNTEHHYLAISGGGANGAFGAGLLVGWTESGTRPEFTVVTGISTGALTAPFAFLGSDYDDELREIYTRFDTEDLVEDRGIFAFLRQDALKSSTPLQAVIDVYIDADLVARLAQEYAKGRALIVGTTNIDTMRPVAWNLTRIAASDAPNRIELIGDILLASASLPVGLPPVLFSVEANGQLYEEMHVDGGATAQVFFYPSGLDWGRLLERFNVSGSPQLYVIRNAQLTPKHQVVERRTAAIGMRTVDSLLRTQGIGDLYRIFSNAQRDGLDYHGASIPDEFSMESTEMFDPVYMRTLFEIGYDMAGGGYPWATRPPGM